jgi:hypothetical protein
MKRLLFLIAVLFAAMLISMPATTSTRAAEGATKQKSVVTFDQPVTLMGFTLKGDYLFVHDDAAMARGDACTYVYKGHAETMTTWSKPLHAQRTSQNWVLHVEKQANSVWTTELQNFSLPAAPKGIWFRGCGIRSSSGRSQTPHSFGFAVLDEAAKPIRSDRVIKH